MRLSKQEQQLQKTSYEGCPGKNRLETERISEAHSSVTANSYKKANQKSCTTNLLERIVESKNMNEAVKQVERNKGSHGTDGMTVDMLRPYLLKNGRALVQEILGGRYKPQPVRRVDIPKPDGGKRGLGIPTVVDRVVQQAIAQVLTQVFEPEFSEHSYGFRPRKSAHDALKQAREYMNAGYNYVVDLDLEKFFDRVNHDILMSLIAKKVQDKRVLKLIRKYLEAGVMEKGLVKRTEEGTPQGGPLSPLLSNIMLNELDKMLEERGHKFCRYADDCNIYVGSKRAGERVMASVRKFIERKLKLKVNEEKSAVAGVTRRKFLGYSFYGTKQGYRFRVHSKTLKRLKEKIREATNRNISMNLEYRIEKLMQRMRGWINYYGLADMKQMLIKIDQWTRRRLRACIWKTWKKIKTRYQRLRELGIEQKNAWMFANTRKGSWRISKSPILNVALSNEYLDSCGYISMSAMYNRVRSA